MKITLIELNLWYSTVTYQSALTSISDFFLLSEVVTIQQTDNTVYKLKPRLFYKSTYLQVYLVDFDLWCELHLTPSFNHTIKSLLECYFNLDPMPHYLLLNKVTLKQRLKIKSSIVNTNNHLNDILLFFDSLYKELSPGFCLVDTF